MTSPPPSDASFHTHMYQLRHLVQVAPELYAQLVLVVGPAHSGKTRLLQALGSELAVEPLNVSVELSKRLMSEDRTLLPLRAASKFAKILESTGAAIQLLDNLEFLFDRALGIDPLTLLQQNARSRTLVVAWPGWIRNHRLTYAEPGHPEYRAYPTTSTLIMDLTSAIAPHD